MRSVRSMRRRKLDHCVFFKASVAHAATGQHQLYERVKVGDGISPPKLCPSLLSFAVEQQFLGDWSFTAEDSSPAVTLPRVRAVPLGIIDYAKQYSLSTIMDKTCKQTFTKLLICV